MTRINELLVLSEIVKTFFANVKLLYAPYPAGVQPNALQAAAHFARLEPTNSVNVIQLAVQHPFRLLLGSV